MVKNIKFGLKLWSTNTALIDKAVKLVDENIFDYIELFVVPDTDITPFLVDVPYVIHIPHHQFGVSIGEANKKVHSLDKIRESLKWADRLDARYLILHAGTGSMESAKDLLSEVNDNRLLVENMPKLSLDDELMIGYSPEQIEGLTGAGEMGLCLDFGHAVKAAVSLGVDYKEYVKGFMGFDPQMFHVSDGTLIEEKDEHLGIGDGEYDFGFLMDCVKNRTVALVTLETPRISLDEDVRNLYILKKYI